MKNPIRWLMSLVFILQMYVAMVVFALAYAIPSMISREGAWAGIHAYCRWVCFSLRLICGLKTEVRGTVPTGEMLIAVDVQGHGLADDVDGVVAGSLRPAAGVEVALEIAVVLAVMRGDAGKHSLAE